MHYAKVKCDRYQESWVRHIPERRDFWKQGYIRNMMKLKTGGFSDSEYNTKEYYEAEAKSYLEAWEKYPLDDRHMIQNQVLNGQCVLWEGEVNQERLREGDNLFIPNIEKYLEIKRVELHQDGTIVYYVEYKKVFNDTVEIERLKCVEEWFTTDYGQHSTFEELKKYKNAISEDHRSRLTTIKDFEDFENNTNALDTRPKIATNSKEDKNTEILSIIVGVIFIGMVSILFALGLSK